MKISIISPIKNCVNTIERAIKSVIRERENGADIEYIIIDSVSTDGTLDIISKYKEYIDVLVSEKDNGINSALNKGIKLAHGDFIFMLAGDDYLLNNSINNFNKLLKPDTDVFSGAMIRNIAGYHIYIPSKDLEQLHYGCCIWHPATFFKRELYKKYGYYDDTLKVAGDMDIFLKFYINGVKFQIENCPIVFFNEGGISQNFLISTLDETKKVAMKYGVSEDEANKYYFVSKGTVRKIKNFVWNIIKKLGLYDYVRNLKDKSEHYDLSKTEINDLGIHFG